MTTFTLINEIPCQTCGVTLHRRWDGSGRDFSWTDADGGSKSNEAGPEGITDVYSWLDWLREHDIARYSSFKARVDLGCGILPWQHWHRPSGPTTQREPGAVVPECCDMPAQLCRDGWECRVSVTPIESCAGRSS